MSLTPQLLALASSVAYAVCFVSARRGMTFSTPITVTCVSVVVHAVTLWTAVFLTGGIPEVEPTAVLLFVFAGVLQPVIRLLTYAGIDKIGAARSGPLRAVHPLYSVLIAIVVLHEAASLTVLLGVLSVVSGIVLISWQREEKQLTFRWWHLLLPLTASLLAGIVHPIRRVALGISNYPLFFAALVGLVSLFTTIVYLALPGATQWPVWNRKAAGPLLTASICETAGLLLGITALSLGPVVLVSPIIAVSPLWVLLGTVVFLRDMEKVNPRTVLGTFVVVAGTTAISLGR